MSLHKRATIIKALELLDFIEQQGDRANESLVAAKAGGSLAYDRYFGPNGMLTRQRVEMPHPITGIKGPVEIVLVETWWEGREKLHRRADHGKRCQRMFRDQILFWGPYSEVSGGKLQPRGRTSK